jgi:hypothetical protein
MINSQSVWRRAKRTNFILMIVGLILGGLAACNAGSSGTGNSNTVTPTRATPSLTATSSSASFRNLEDDASQWGIFYDGGSATAKLDNITSPGVDGTALKISLVSGQPYTGIHAYRNLNSADTATSFEMNLSFHLSSATPIQALEFTMSTWVNNQRWEWALQWEHIGDGTQEQGNPPTWRVWTGKSWQNIGVRQQLSTNTWHHLHLEGDISSGQVHYIRFSCDDTSANLGQIFAPVSNPGNKLAVAVQLDGNNHEDSYQVYIDQVDFQWK